MNINILFNKNLSSNTIFLGLFLINWSYISFFIGGSFAKSFLLFLGFFILTLFSFLKKKPLIFFKISIITFLYFTFLTLYGNFMFHNLSDTLILFGYLNCLLFLLGVLITYNIDNINLPKFFVIWFLIFLVVIGSFFYFTNGNIVRLDDNVDLYSSQKDSGINRIGLGYTNIIIFFIFYNLRKNYNKVQNSIIYCILFLIIIQLFHLQARGVLIFLFFVLFINNLKQVLKFKYVFKKIIVLLFIFFTAYQFILFYAPSYLDIVQGTFDRFEGIEGLFNSEKKLEASALERKKYIDYFFDNYNDFIFTGIKNYSPYPHNIFIEILERFGILLGLPILVTLLYSGYKAFILVYRRNVNTVLINVFSMIYLYCFFQSFTSLNLENNRSLWISMGVVLFYKFKKN